MEHARFDDPHAAVPTGRFLSHSGYRVFITASGTGYSHYQDHALTRWNADPIEDRSGWFLYLRDLDTNDVWSAARQPVAGGIDHYAAAWNPGLVEITRRTLEIETVLSIALLSEAAAEVRSLTVRNRSGRRRRIEITSYLEVVLNSREADAAHPAFSKLFVQTEHLKEKRALLARRRPRSAEERHPWMVHVLGGEDAYEWETDRRRFLGRTGSLTLPGAIAARRPLSGTVGNVLDPVLCFRRSVEIGPGGERRVTFLLGAAESRDEAIAVAERGRRLEAAEDPGREAIARETGEIERLGLRVDEAEYFQALAGAVLFGEPTLRGLARGAERAGDLDTRAGAGDFDFRARGLTEGKRFAVLHAEAPAGARRIETIARAHSYWVEKGIPIDLLVLTDDADESATGADDATPCSFLKTRASELSASDLAALDARAGLVIRDALPDLRRPRTAPAAEPAPLARPAREAAGAAPSSGELGAGLRLFNGIGGFSEDGREYVMRLLRDGNGPLAKPPLPWINVIANERFGFFVSESGAGATWSVNSREHRLTAWSNDPVLDPHGEALYLRDDETGEFWSPLPGPRPAAGDYEVRHGFGYSTFALSASGLEHETCVFADRDAPVKITRLRLANRSGRARRLSLVSYQRLVLGANPETTRASIVTAIDRSGGVILARNPHAGAYAGGVAFAAAAPPAGASRVRSTCDRAAFVGAGGDLSAPRALQGGAEFDDSAESGGDPCFAQWVSLVLEPGASTECSFLFGEGRDEAEARAILARLGTSHAVERALSDARETWRTLFSALRIETPDPALDILVNGWLPYQNLGCRIWGRSAFYQSGGAFGYRDQLQDASALTVLAPERARSQLLLHAAHQFVEGDVLHWWHPPRARGLRTRFADDLLWLPYLTAEYVGTTGDWGILEERAGFVSARPLREDEDEAFLATERAPGEADLYEHCCRAIDRSLATGVHGLPLFGSGDWNDAMNRVGREGRGESVWMGFFLHSVLTSFLPLCARRDDAIRARLYEERRDALGAALNEEAWDGEWYRRAYYDDGAPLGSRESDECRIDALAQAWAVISGVAPPERAAAAMDSVERHLISDREKVIRLLTPPFENTPRDPGYIKGYVPGVRENGGQYTHAALWVVRAMAELGRYDRAAPLLAMLCPTSHTRTAAEVAVYGVEPYVVVADVYGAAPHVGRGGWTWYTGSAGWMHRVAVESVLGFRVRGGDTIVLRPCIPSGWPEFRIEYRDPRDGTRYDIRIRNTPGSKSRVATATLDDAPAPVRSGAAEVPLVPGGGMHRVEVVLR